MDKQMEKQLDKLMEMFDTLETSINKEIAKGIEKCNTEKMSKAFDMLRDTAETMYYITEFDAVKSNGANKDMHKDAIGSVSNKPKSIYMNRDFDRDMDYMQAPNMPMSMSNMPE